jgi:hypothetical protein
MPRDSKTFLVVPCNTTEPRTAMVSTRLKSLRRLGIMQLRIEALLLGEDGIVKLSIIIAYCWHVRLWVLSLDEVSM